MGSNQAELNGIILLHKTMHRTGADNPKNPVVGFSGNVNR